MADLKISELPIVSSPSGEDMVPVVANPSSTPVNKVVTLDVLFGNVPSNTYIYGTFTVDNNATFVGSNVYSTANVNIVGKTTLATTVISSNGVVIQNSLTPANNSVPAIATGKFFWDEDYLYVKVSNSEIKRVALSSF